MNPFDQPPSDAPVSFDPPNPLVQPAPRRGRMVLVAVAAAGVMGAGLIGISQFASADPPEVVPAAGGDLAAVAPPSDDEPGDDESNGGDDGDVVPSVEGEIVIDSGDGEPIVIDLGEGTINGESFEQFAECIGMPVFGGEIEGSLEEIPFEDMEGMLEDFDFGELEGMLEDFDFEDMEGMLEDFDFEQFGEFGGFGPHGSHVTVLGPDGPTMIEFGDEDGSVTITQQGGELTVETEGSATVSEFEEVFGAFEFPIMEGLDIEQMLGEMPLDGFDLEGFEFELPADIQDCLDGIQTG